MHLSQADRTEKERLGSCLSNGGTLVHGTVEIAAVLETKNVAELVGHNLGEKEIGKGRQITMSRFGKGRHNTMYIPV